LPFAQNTSIERGFLKLNKHFTQLIKYPTYCSTHPAKIVRLVLPGAMCIQTCRQCDCNELRSLVDRHGNTNEARLDDPNELGMVASCFNNFIKFKPPHMLIPDSISKVISSKPIRKRKTYLNAAKSLAISPLSDRDSVVKMFIKNERMDNSKAIKPPRAIQARSPRFNLLLQTYLAPIERHLFHQPFRKLLTTKCLNLYQKAEYLKFGWDQFKDPVAVLMDHNRFDSRIHSGWLKAEHAYYKSFYPNDAFLAELLNKQITNHGLTRHGGSYTVKGTRCSGDVNTSLGNSIVNLSIIFDWLQLVENKFVTVDGDDSVIILERVDLHLLDFVKLSNYGFATKHEIVHNFNDIEYCQCKPVRTINGWLMVRTPHRVISRSTTCIDRNYNSTPLFRRWCNAVGQCEAAVNKAVPVLQSFARFLIRFSDKSLKLSSVDNHYLNRSVSVDNLSEIITEESRHSFYLSFGISVPRQLELENQFDSYDLDDLCEYEVEEPTLNSSTMQSLLYIN
jgi:hypothetical protein